jgi:hypothetical protein
MLSNWIAAATLASLLNASPDSRQFVELVSAPHVTVAAGKPAAVELRFHVSQGFHINSNLPRSSYLIPTKLSLNPPTDVGVGKVTYPPGRDIELSFAPGEKLNVYTGDRHARTLQGAWRPELPGLQ